MKIVFIGEPISKFDTDACFNLADAQANDFAQIEAIRKPIELFCGDVKLLVSPTGLRYTWGDLEANIQQLRDRFELLGYMETDWVVARAAFSKLVVVGQVLLVDSIPHQIQGAQNGTTFAPARRR